MVTGVESGFDLRGNAMEDVITAKPEPEPELVGQSARLDGDGGLAFERNRDDKGWRYNLA